MKPLRVFCFAFALFAAAACSEMPEEPQVLSITPGREPRELLVGAEQQLTAQLGGRAVRAVWTTSDTAIARVDTNGLLRIASTYAACGWVEPGDCVVDVVARVDGITSSQRITVMPFVERIAPAIYMEMGDSVRLAPRFAVEGREVSWCILGERWSWNTAVARVPNTGFVVAGDTGTTKVEIEVTGRACPFVSVPVTVSERLHTLAIHPAEEFYELQAGQAVQLSAYVTNYKGVEYPALTPRWSSSDNTIISVEGGRVVAIGCRTVVPCQATITVTSGRLIASRTISVTASDND
jgi:hypothetical protein